MINDRMIRFSSFCRCCGVWDESNRRSGQPLLAEYGSEFFLLCLPDVASAWCVMVCIDFIAVGVIHFIHGVNKASDPGQGFPPGIEVSNLPKIQTVPQVTTV